jgi:hypothetical protein
VSFPVCRFSSAILFSFDLVAGLRTIRAAAPKCNLDLINGEAIGIAGFQATRCTDHALHIAYRVTTAAKVENLITRLASSRLEQRGLGVGAGIADHLEPAEGATALGVRLACAICSMR